MAYTTAESGVELTDKQLIFCTEYLTTWNAAKAAIVSGSNPDSAKQIGYEMLQREDVKAHIEWMKDKIFQIAEVSQLRNVRELAKIAYSSAADFREDWYNVRNWDELSEENKAMISEITVTNRTLKGDLVEESVTFKLYNKLDAIKTLNAMAGWNAPKKLEHTGKDGEAIAITRIIIE